MKRSILVAIVTAVLLFHGVAAACTMLNKKEVQIGDKKGVQGVCSNNGLPISCTFISGEGISCDGPEGGVNGNDLSSLIFSVCGCSGQEERELKEKQVL